MNEKLSALLDGELDRADAMAAIKQLSSDQARRECWDTYHLIGEVLRAETTLPVERHRAAAATIFARLAKEPTVLAPVASRPLPGNEKRTRLVVAMAASVVTLSAIVVVAYKQQGGIVAPSQLANIAPLPSAAVAAPPQDLRVNDYLAIHRQFANRGALQAASVRTSEAQAVTAK